MGRKLTVANKDQLPSLIKFWDDLVRATVQAAVGNAERAQKAVDWLFAVREAHGYSVVTTSSGTSKTTT